VRNCASPPTAPRLAGLLAHRHAELADELPETATGKIGEPDLRDRYVTTEENPA